MYPAFPDGVTELHLDVEDQPHQDLLSKFEEIYEFLGEEKELYNMEGDCMTMIITWSVRGRHDIKHSMRSSCSCNNYTGNLHLVLVPKTVISSLGLMLS